MLRLGSVPGGSIRIAIPAIVVATLISCGAGGESPGAGNGTPAPGEQRSTPAAADRRAQNDAAGAAGGGENEAQAYERNWRIGDGGEVGVRFEDGALDLLDARPNEGWDVEVEERSADEIEVGFSRGDEAWTFEADVDGGRLEVRTRQELRDAQAGTYRLGEAGAVELRQEDGGITLVQTQSIGGWSTDVVQQDGENVEVRFDRRDDWWRLEARVEDGRLQVDTVHKVTEPVRG